MDTSVKTLEQISFETFVTTLGSKRNLTEDDFKGLETLSDGQLKLILDKLLRENPRLLESIHEFYDETSLPPELWMIAMEIYDDPNPSKRKELKQSREFFLKGRQLTMYDRARALLFQRSWEFHFDFFKSFSFYRDSFSSHEACTRHLRELFPKIPKRIYDNTNFSTEHFAYSYLLTDMYPGVVFDLPRWTRNESQILSDNYRASKEGEQDHNFARSYRRHFYTLYLKYLDFCRSRELKPAGDPGLIKMCIDLKVYPVLTWVLSNWLNDGYERLYDIIWNIAFTYAVMTKKFKIAAQLHTVITNFLDSEEPYDPDSHTYPTHGYLHQYFLFSGNDGRNFQDELEFLESRGIYLSSKKEYDRSFLEIKNNPFMWSYGGDLDYKSKLRIWPRPQKWSKAGEVYSWDNTETRTRSRILAKGFPGRDSFQSFPYKSNDDFKFFPVYLLERYVKLLKMEESAPLGSNLKQEQEQIVSTVMRYRDMGIFGIGGWHPKRDLLEQLHELYPQVTTPLETKLLFSRKERQREKAREAAERRREDAAEAAERPPEGGEFPLSKKSRTRGLMSLMVV